MPDSDNLLPDRHDKSEYFGEALLHLLNKQHYPYEKEVKLRQMLRFLQVSHATSRHVTSCRVLPGEGGGGYYLHSATNRGAFTQ